MSRKKINRCVECKEPLRHIQNNQWMCEQSPNNCKMSIKVIYLNNPAQEEEWLGYQYYLWYCFTMLSILHGEANARMKCPVCYVDLFEKNAGLYCYTPHCPAYMQKAISCCEGGPIEECAI